MKYYDESVMGDLRKAFEKKVLKLPKVEAKKMMGCPCYFADGKMFAFLVKSGIVLTKLPESDRESVDEKFEAQGFDPGHGRKIMKNWTQVFVEVPDDIDRLMPYVKKSYAVALAQEKKQTKTSPKTTKRKKR